MKKSLIAVFIPIILCVTLFSFCGCEKKYKLTIVGDESLLRESLKKSYAAGETVTVKVPLLDDAAVVVKLNGTTLLQSIQSGSENLYALYKFTMPDKDSTLELSVAGGMW